MQYEEIESLLLDGPTDGWASTLSFEEFCLVSGGYGGSPTGVGTAAQWGAWASCVQAGIELGESLAAIAARNPGLAMAVGAVAANDYGECMADNSSGGEGGGGDDGGGGVGGSGSGGCGGGGCGF